MKPFVKKSLAVAISAVVLCPAPSWAAVAGRAPARPGASAGIGRAAVSAVPALPRLGVGALNPIGALGNLKAPSVLPAPAGRTSNAAAQRPAVALPAVLPAVRPAASVPASAAANRAAAPAQVGALSRPVAGAFGRTAEGVSGALRAEGPAGPKGSFSGLGRVFDGAGRAAGSDEDLATLGKWHYLREAAATETDAGRLREAIVEMEAFQPSLALRAPREAEGFAKSMARARLRLALLEDGAESVESKIDPELRRTLDAARGVRGVAEGGRGMRIPDVARLQDGGKSAPRPDTTRAVVLERLERMEEELPLAAVQAAGPGWRARLGFALQDGAALGLAMSSVLFTVFSLASGLAPQALLGGYAAIWAGGSAALWSGGKLVRSELRSGKLPATAGHVGRALDARQSAVLSVLALAIGTAAGYLAHLFLAGLGVWSSAGWTGAAAVLPAAIFTPWGFMERPRADGRDPAAFGSLERVRMRLNAEVETRREVPGSPYSTVGWTLGFLKDHEFEIELKELPADPRERGAAAERWEGAYTTVVEKEAGGAPARVEATVRLRKIRAGTDVTYYLLEIAQGNDTVYRARAGSLAGLRGVELIQVNGKPTREEGKSRTPSFGLKVLPGLMLLPVFAVNPLVGAVIGAVFGGMLGLLISELRGSPSGTEAAAWGGGGAGLGIFLNLSVPPSIWFGVFVGVAAGFILGRLLLLGLYSLTAGPDDNAVGLSMLMALAGGALGVFSSL